MKPAFYLQNISIKFGSREVLAIPELSIESGRITALIGPSGAGKSTLLRLLNMLQKPSTGRIDFFGQPLFENGKCRECQRSMTLVFQKPALFTGSVQYNIALGLKLRGMPAKVSAKKVQHALELVGLQNLARQEAHTLSGGEAQRVALARALVLEPKVLLLDEPTASLDPGNVRILEELIRRIHLELGNTIIVVTHNFYQAKRLSDYTIFLDEGRVVEHRPTSEFFARPENDKTRAFLDGDMIY